MYRFHAAALAAAALAGAESAAVAQVSTPATPMVGTPVDRPLAGPPAPSASQLAPPLRTGPVPPRLTIAQAIEEAAARSPAITAAQAELAAAEARARQAGYRQNPELSVQVENFGGTGVLKGARSAETTVSLNQRLDLGGRRSARVRAARAALELEQLRLAIARADVALSVRQGFARALAARQQLEQTQERVEWATELARVAGVLVEAGREPPLRSLRARSALAQARAENEAARAEELAARTSLTALFGGGAPVEAVIGDWTDVTSMTISVPQSLELRLAQAEIAAANAELQVQLAERRLDPAVGAGVRRVNESGDFGFVAGISLPLQIFNRNQGNIAAARQSVAAAEARRAAALAGGTARGRNAISAVEGAQRRVAALEGSAVPEAREGLRLAQIAYTEGKAALVELLDAQNAYTQTQTALTEARLALALATAELGRLAAQ